MKKTFLAVVIVGLSCGISACSAKEPAREPDWERGAVRFGEQREQIQNTPLLERPYRPLHVYGNTVRRIYYRGRALPDARDIGALRRFR